MKKIEWQKIYNLIGRKRVIMGIIILIVLLFITTMVSLVQALRGNEQQEKIIYTENSFIDYKVNLKENEFYNKDYLESNKQYIASLIEEIEANFKYNLESTEKNASRRATYKIVANTTVEEEANKKSIYTFSENLIKEKEISFNSNSPFELNESVKIDYNKYNNIINKFVRTYSLVNYKSTLTINMYVNVEGVTQSSMPVATLIIPLTTRTVGIDIQSNIVNETDLSIYKDIADKENLYVAVLTFALTIMVIIELYIFTNNTKDYVSLYKTRIKRILLNYGSYIQKVNNNFNYEGYQVIEMTSIEDLLQIRDTINKPILMEKAEKETDFFIPSEENVIYIYRLKLEDFKKGKNLKK